MMKTKSFEPTLETLGSRIRERRKRLGLSQGDLGGLLMLDAYQIGRIERGLRDPSVLLLHRLAEALQCEVGALLGNLTQSPAPAADRARPGSSLPEGETTAVSKAATADRDGAEVRPEEVRNFRREHRLSQQRLGELCGVAQSTVFRWEAGEAPSGPAAIVLRQLLTPKPTASPPPLTPAEERLFNELIERGNFTSRRDYLAAALTQLILKGAADADPL